MVAHALQVRCVYYNGGVIAVPSIWFMMIKIIIDECDSFYRHGMNALLGKVFLEQFDECISVTSEMAPHSIAMADVIVLGLSPGEISICHPFLHARKKNSLILGIYEGNHKPQFDDLPLCFKNIIFINRTEPVSRIKKKIFHGWESCRTQSILPHHWKCHDCKHKTLSPQQINVATHYYRGDRAEQIAGIMHISVKTVFTHKRMIMGKFDVHSDYELFTLLKVMKALNHNTPDFLETERELKRA